MTERILIIKQGALGDFFIALGAFQAIRAFHATAQITLLTAPAYVQLAKETGIFDSILADNRPKWYQVFQLYHLRHQLLKGHFTRVYDLQNSPRTSWYFKLLGPGKRPEWNGIAPGCSHPQRLPNRRKVHAYPRFKDQLAVAGIQEVLWPDLSWIPESNQSFDLVSPYVLLVPGSSPSRLMKRWPAEKYAECAQALWVEGFLPVVLGGVDDQSSIKVLRQMCPQVRDLSGKTCLYDIVHLARSATAIIGNDTGPLHIASIAQCPTIVLWSKASDPTVFAPQGDHVTVLVEPDLKNLSVQRVLDAFKKRVKITP